VIVVEVVVVVIVLVTVVVWHKPHKSKQLSRT